MNDLDLSKIKKKIDSYASAINREKTTGLYDDMLKLKKTIYESGLYTDLDEVSKKKLDQIEDYIEKREPPTPVGGSFEV